MHSSQLFDTTAQTQIEKSTYSNLKSEPKLSLCIWRALENLTLWYRITRFHSRLELKIQNLNTTLTLLSPYIVQYISFLNSPMKTWKKQAQKLFIIHNWIFPSYCPELPICPKIENPYRKLFWGTLCYIYFVEYIL